MCTRAQCLSHVGRPVQFYTPYGYHMGIIERVTSDSVIVSSPRKYIPAQLASNALPMDDAKRIDAVLAWGGFGRGFGRGFGGYPGGAFGGRGAYGAYGGFGGFGWARWAVSWLIIFALFGLWW